MAALFPSRSHLLLAQALLRVSSLHHRGRQNQNFANSAASSHSPIFASSPRNPNVLLSPDLHLNRVAPSHHQVQRVTSLAPPLDVRHMKSMLVGQLLSLILRKMTKISTLAESDEVIDHSPCSPMHSTSPSTRYLK